MSRLLFSAVVVAAIALPAFSRDDKDTKFVKLLNVETGKVLAIADNSTEASAKAVLAKDGDSESLQWKLERDGNFLKMVNRKSKLVLDVFESSRDEGAAVIQWDEKGDDNDNQRWAWSGEGKERRLKSKSSDLVLVADKDGNIVQKKLDEKDKGQLWSVVEVK
ncbi:RICIN domain-containing protein [Fimbriiglobus ruber]|uniref:Ricin-type beta-trefoil lectin domain-like n=1 Tax=Fimbriiglobus ruber TaxID=1908690 RepID=A0A225DHI7_9BACT|nr:RICIN domain-containing protein [Fimbriiglobus ruber]OWK38028.1 Ricin-type beta-trefoil lectin domain-like [Fimbriiglobus ruber]